MKIGFIGLGVMGNSMAFHLMRAGYDVHLYTRTKSKAENLLEHGAVWEESVADLAQHTDIIITMIGTPQDVESVYFGAEGILENARANAYVIDMTTSKPSLAKKIYDAAKEKNIHALDAPVSGGDIGAREASLTIMVGGDAVDFEAMEEIFEIMGENIVHQGDAGAGQYTKLANQIAIAPGMIGLAEALVFSKNAGLDQTTVLQSISAGAAGSWSMDNYGPRMIFRTFDPGFAIKHYIKDLRIAVEAAEEMNMNTPGLQLALQIYEELGETGELESGIHAIIKYFE